MEPPKNAAREIIGGKGSGKSHRRSSLSNIRGPLRALRNLSISSTSTASASSSDSALLAPPHERKRTMLRKSSKTHEPEAPPSSVTSSHASTGSLSWGSRPHTSHHLGRAHSKASSQDFTERGSVSTSTRPTSPSGSVCNHSQGTSISGDFVGVIKAGPLHHESTLLKTKKEFLVLTPSLLLRFKSRNAALDQFPQLSSQLSVPPTAAESGLSPVDSVMSLRDFAAGSGSGSSSKHGAELQIPLETVVTAFKEEGAKPCFGIEVWWKDQIDGSTFTSTELDFNLPDERDEWLKHIRLAVKQRARSFLEDQTSSDVEADFAQILAAQSPQHGNVRPEIFPVVPRHPYTRAATNSSGEIKKGWRDNSSFYLALGKNVCMLAQFSKSPTGQRVNPNIVKYGLVTLSKVNAHLGDERFDLIFRLPMDTPKKIGLSSRHHRSIISRLFKADTYLKPAWPLWTRREIFFVDGETDHIHLPEGEDYGGFKRTLEAYLEGYHCASVDWKLLRPKKKMLKYSGYQLLAVFRALRFNDYFKSLNFDGVDFSPLSGVQDNQKRLEPTPWLSRTGKRSLTRDEYELMEHSSVLFQELVGLLLASESVKQVNLNGVLSGRFVAAASGSAEASAPRNRGCDLIPPIVLLLRSLQSRCKSIFLNNNPMSAADVGDLCQTLQNYAGLARCLGLSRCDLDEVAMTSVWEAIHEQRSSLETLEFANNFGRLDAARAAQTLSETPKIRHLDLGYCLKGANFDTISCLLRYMETEESNGMKHLILNNCGIDGEVATAIICGVGSGRDMHLHMNGNPLEDVSTDWIDLIEGNEGPRRMHMNMVQFETEDNFNRLLEALTNNSTIEFLSMVGTGSPAGATPKTLTCLANLLERNTTLQYLDLSGYSGKLEDSHMGWGLSGALSGLKHNRTLRQLRLRNHNIGDAEDVTELCRVLAQNQGLVMFDLQANNFSHHQFGQLVRAMDHNGRLLSFPLAPADRQYALDEERRLFLDVLHSKHKTKRDGSLKPLSKTDEGRLKEMLAFLEEHWDTEARRLADILRRNRDDPANRHLEFGDEYLGAWEDDELPAWLYAKLAARTDGVSGALSAAGSRRSSVQSISGHQHQRRDSAASQFLAAQQAQQLLHGVPASASHHIRTSSVGSFTLTPFTVAAPVPLPMPEQSSSSFGPAPSLTPSPTLPPLPSFSSSVDYGSSGSGGDFTMGGWSGGGEGGGPPVVAAQPSSLLSNSSDYTMGGWGRGGGGGGGPPVAAPQPSSLLSGVGIGVGVGRSCSVSNSIGRNNSVGASGGTTYTIAEETSPFSTGSSSGDYIGCFSSADSSMATPPERNKTPPPSMPPMAEKNLVTPPPQVRPSMPQQNGSSHHPSYQVQIDSPDHHRRQQSVEQVGEISPGMSASEYRKLMEDLTGHW
ncbi:hypothetical protein PG988_016268 [Apiospora saccharicola]